MRCEVFINVLVLNVTHNIREDSKTRLLIKQAFIINCSNPHYGKINLYYKVNNKALFSAFLHGI